MNFDIERDHIINQFNETIYTSDKDHESYVLNLFHFQYKYNKIFREYCKNLGVNNDEVSNISDVPYLPISAFKHHAVKTGNFHSSKIFKSSGTISSKKSSSHHVRDMEFYLNNTIRIWTEYFNPVAEYCFMALLPGYLERQDSSLIAMVSRFIELSDFSESGFYLRNHKELYDNLERNKKRKIPTVLFGVSYALLDFLSVYEVDYPDLIVIETGGMKGQRVELTKHELQSKLSKGFNVPTVYSEYGMTELLSQAYSVGQKFKITPAFRVATKQINDPLSFEKNGKPGIISVIDFANIDSCAFIQTEDIGILLPNDTFELLGRLDATDARGCNLMMEEIIL